MPPSLFMLPMKNNGEFSTFQLKNGLRVVHKEIDRPVAHCGLMINAGTRDEIDGEHGIAHFIEHAIFKGVARVLDVLGAPDALHEALPHFDAVDQRVARRVPGSARRSRRCPTEPALALELLRELARRPPAVPAEDPKVVGYGSSVVHQSSKLH